MSFSCLISSFKKDPPEQLKKCLESLVVQSKPASEIIFVKDGFLTKELEETLSKFEDKLPLVYIQLEVNKGLGNALHVGLEACSHDIVMRMDTDDICYPNRFELQYNFLMQNPDVDIVGGWAHDINSNDEITGERKYAVSHDDIYRLIWTSPFIHPTVAFRRNRMISIGSYDPDVVRRQDYELWIRAAYHKFRFANIPEFLIKYRFTENYYNKNNSKVAFDQAVMGFKGAWKLKLPLYTYFAVFIPYFRSLMPSWLIRPLHKWMTKFDPRKKLN